MQPIRPRPPGITILGILAILIGLLGLVGGAVLLTSPDAFVVGLSAFAVVVGILYLVTGIGFLQGARWGWVMGLIVSVLALVRNVIEAIQGGVIFAIPGILVALIIIYYLTRPKVKEFFGRGRMPNAG